MGKGALTTQRLGASEASQRIGAYSRIRSRARFASSQAGAGVGRSRLPRSIPTGGTGPKRTRTAFEGNASSAPFASRHATRTQYARSSDPNHGSTRRSSPVLPREALSRGPTGGRRATTGGGREPSGGA